MAEKFPSLSPLSTTCTIQTSPWSEHRLSISANSEKFCSDTLIEDDGYCRRLSARMSCHQSKFKNGGGKRELSYHRTMSKSLFLTVCCNHQRLSPRPCSKAILGYSSKSASTVYVLTKEKQHTRIMSSLSLSKKRPFAKGEIVWVVVDGLFLSQARLVVPMMMKKNHLTTGGEKSSSESAVEDRQAVEVQWIQTGNFQRVPRSTIRFFRHGGGEEKEGRRQTRSRTQQQFQMVPLQIFEDQSEENRRQTRSRTLQKQQRSRITSPMMIPGALQRQYTNTPASRKRKMCTSAAEFFTNATAFSARKMKSMESTSGSRETVGELKGLPEEVIFEIFRFLKFSSDDYSRISQVCKYFNHLSKHTKSVWLTTYRLKWKAEYKADQAYDAYTSAVDLAEENSPQKVRTLWFNGSTYRGEVEEEDETGMLLPHGLGIWWYNDTDSRDHYGGQWDMGEKHGVGSLFTSDGTYFGSFKDNKRHGRGISFYDRKDDDGHFITYAGFYKNDQRCGLGMIQRHPDGKSYHDTQVGRYSNGTPFGVHMHWKREDATKMAKAIDFGTQQG